MRLYLWKIERVDNVGYDEYDSAVVVARNEADARMIRPSGEKNEYDKVWKWYGWAAPETIKVTKVGTAAPELKAGEVIVASYNAG